MQKGFNKKQYTLENTFSRPGKNPIFRTPKWRKVAYRTPFVPQPNLILSPPTRLKVAQCKQDTLDPRNSRHLRNRIFRRPQCRKVAHMKPLTLELRISRHGKNSFSKTPKCSKVAYRKLGNLQPRFSWPLKKRIFREPKCQIVLNGLRMALDRWFHDHWVITFSFPPKC
jgi:hypothetical protein